MAIYIWPADTRPGPTLMGRILPDPLRNRVKYRFIKKKKPDSSPGFIKNPARTWTRIWPNYSKITKTPLIYMVVNPKSLTHPPLIISFQFQLTPHASCPHPNPQSLCHSCSHAQEHASASHSISHLTQSLTHSQALPAKLSTSHRRSKLSTSLVPSPTVTAGLFSTSLQFFFFC